MVQRAERQGCPSPCRLSRGAVAPDPEPIDDIPRPRLWMSQDWRLVGRFARPPTRPPPTAFHPAPPSRHQTAGWQDRPLTVNRLRFSQPGGVPRAFRLSGILIQEAIGCRWITRRRGIVRGWGWVLRSASQSQAKSSPGLWSTTCMRLARLLSGLASSLWRKRDILPERTTATDSSSVTPALLLDALLARSDAAADPAATPPTACGRRPVP